MRAVTSHRQRGFTLIELLVVIFIIAMLAGMATLSLSNTDSRNWTGEVQRLANLLQLVADRAVIDKSHYGVVFEDHRYTVVRYESNAMEWQEIDFSGIPGASGVAGAQKFTAHQLPPIMRLEILSQTELPGAQDEQASFGGNRPSNSAADEGGKRSRKKDEKILPQFAALSSGEVLPVEIGFFLMKDGDIARAAIISYSSLYGMQLEWQSDDY
ncbi:prepilin-type N-terminal cleavage/methylation domain-containing protein [Microbulbifer bruguierae]|uniref:Prepilin-type N-terminal cleavage/methylation domain-containing protein n=1 Tax=Microbulbifer bruguierae TaxID=3029061 RepID=A0ABY8NE16_9GAMM|nr:prepilin-type N-terminal cleavage/methylation domain-containing protein [Microbulbifer bruguierae]WGL17153.1 prepilin-type N-terminal cleavage/methylation domain-containing protein [Microbulbifer bruguierae]